MTSGGGGELGAEAATRQSGALSFSALPSKLYFRIGEVASLVGVEPHVLRYWEREFRSIRPTKSAKGQRVYSRRDVENLMRVRQLLYAEGFTIAGARKKLQHSSAPPEAGIDDAHRALDSVETLEERGTAESAPPPGRLRESLVALRSEIEAFLEELGG